MSGVIPVRPQGRWMQVAWQVAVAGCGGVMVFKAQLMEDDTLVLPQRADRSA